MTTFFTNLGAVAMAKELVDAIAADANRDWWIAWGSGDAAWDASPVDPAVTDTALEAHLGHLKATAQFVTSNNSTGTLSTGNGIAWDPSVSATRFIYVEASYDYNDEPSATIRELGVYIDAVPDTGHEAQTYCPAADLASLGTLLAVERIASDPRAPTENGKWKIVIELKDDAA